MNPVLPLVALLAGLILGGVVVWLLLRVGIAATTAGVKAELQNQIAALNERVAARDQQIAGLQASVTAQEDHKSQLAMQLQQEASGRVAAESSTQHLQEKLDAQKQELEALQQKFQRDFQAIAQKLLLENSTRFGQQSAESLDRLLGPFRENLKEFKTRLESVQRETVEHSALLKDQIARIGTEAANLSKALKGEAKVLGNWGENMLDQILERSGLQLGIHYRRQAAAKDQTGEQRFLDVLIALPDDKHLVIDSKVSLKAYEDYVNATEEPVRQQHLQAHIDCIRIHFRSLGAKRYQDIHEIAAPDFVLMYIPIEAAFFAAVIQEPGLFSEALDKNVVLITNSTLLATLRTVAHVWRVADQQKYALEIADRGGKLYDKFAGFIDDLQEIGAALRRAQDLWGEANKKLHQGSGNLLSQVEKLRALGVKASKKLPAPSDEEIQSELLLNNGNGQEEPVARASEPSI